MQREVQRVVQVVVQVGAGADDEVDQAALHQLDDAAAEAGRGHRAGDVRPMVVSCSGASILSEKIRQASPRRAALNA